MLLLCRIPFLPCPLVPRTLPCNLSFLSVVSPWRNIKEVLKWNKKPHLFSFLDYLTSFRQVLVFSTSCPLLNHRILCIPVNEFFFFFFCFFGANKLIDIWIELGWVMHSFHRYLSRTNCSVTYILPVLGFITVSKSRHSICPYGG